jgi:EpsI family protein
MGNERIRLTLLIFLFALTLASVRTAAGYRMAQKRTPDWLRIPYQLADWTGQDTEFDPIYGADPAESSLLRVYHRSDAPPVIVYIGFYGELSKVLEVHTPELCYPAQGWNILALRKPAIGNFREKQIPALEIVTEKDGNRRLVMWWYNAGSRPIQTRIRYVYAMLAMSTLTGRTDGSMVRIETPIVNGNETAAVARMEEFGKDFLPELNEALPK